MPDCVWEQLQQLIEAEQAERVEAFAGHPGQVQPARGPKDITPPTRERQD